MSVPAATARFVRRRRAPRLVTLYVTGVSLVGLALLLAVALADGAETLASAGREVWLFAVIAVVGELTPIKVFRRDSEGEITLSTTFAFALLLTTGLPAAMLALALASMVADLAHRKPAAKSLFNMAQYMTALAAAGGVLALATDIPRAGAMPYAPGDLPAILAAGAVFFIVNSSLVAAVISLSQGYRLWRYYSGDFVFQASNAGMSLGLAPIIALSATFSVGLLPLLALPLVAIYRTGRQAVRIEHQSLHDSLTLLPNRTLLRDRIDQAVRAARRDRASVVVMLIDLDHFKEVNDTLGHHHGDLLLREIGPRLEGALRDTDTIARLGGDEFAILLPSVPDISYGDAVARKVIRALERPFDIEGLKLQIGASIGLASFPEHGDDVEALVQRADIAMYLAKEAQTGYERYDPEQDSYSPGRLTLASDLRRAIEHDELVVHYQPKLELRTGKVRGVEALVRWQHPKRGLVGPSEFVPVAESSGLIAPITMRVLELALAQLAQWLAEGHELDVAVNLSARSLLDRQLPDSVARLLEAARVPPQQLRLEITESMIMADPVRAIAVLSGLDEMGVRLVIDDFGTGYSSLSNLRRLPVSEIKIDKSFILTMTEDRNDAVIVRSTIDLARSLGLGVVAEGVESEQVLEELTRLGCDFAQGYFLSRPVAADVLSRWLAGGVPETRPAAPRPARAEIVVPGWVAAPGAVGS
jgi:diguanylate cyclase (GGDEF)-like protein